MRALVTGGAGFIGSHLVDRLLALGQKVVVYDNFSSGRAEHLSAHSGNPNLSVVRGDLLDLPMLRGAMRGVDFVHHVGANPDIRFGTDHPDWDLQQNLVGTFHVLEAMRVNGCRRLAFASSSTVYGEAQRLPTPEDQGPLLPISLYGASKLGAEAYVAAYAGTFGCQAWIFRFANIVGPRAGHGILADFVAKLRRDPRRLEILGDGRQRKSYLHVDELVPAMLHLIERARERVNVLNLGTGDAVTVRRIAEIVVEGLSLRDVRFDYTGGDRGWLGDVPQMLLDVSAAQRLGWRPRRTSEETVGEGLRDLLTASATSPPAPRGGKF